MRQFKLDKIKATGTTVGDVHFPKVKLLLPFDGSNGATTTSDSSNSNHAITLNADAQISTAQSKFGNSSALFDGTGDYLSLSASSDWQFGTGDFTIEFWIRFGAGSAYQTLWDFNYVSNGALLLQTDNSASPKFRIYLDYGRTSGYITEGSGATLNTWHHYAFVRSSGTATIYRDGTSTVSGSLTGNIDASQSVTIGITRGSTDHPFNGYLDDFRITKGSARYTSNFTPPTTAHLTQAGDVNKHIVVNSDADGVAIGTGGINQARIAKAWAEFDGSGVTLNASYNVSSITDHGNRDYTINFSTAMADTNYSIVGSNIGQTATYNWSVVTSGNGQAKTASAARINVPHINDSSLYGNDPDAVNVIAFGN